MVEIKNLKCYNKIKQRGKSMKELREFIKKLLIQHNLYNIPIDIIELAKKEGFDVLQQDLDGYSGAILVCL